MIRFFARLLFVAGAFALGVGSKAAASDGTKLNVLFIIADDLNTDLGCYGDPVVKSPHIDALARRGVRFERAYCQYPVCGPSRVSFMTSLRPNTTRILTNTGRNAQGVYQTSPHFREFHPNTVTLPQLFRNHGWWAARVGKIYHYGVPGQIGTNGLDDPISWDVRINPIGRDKREEAAIFSLNPEAPIYARFGGTLSWKQMDGSPLDQTDGIGATEAIRLLEEKRDQPFFLAVGFYRPHTPFVATKEFFDLYPLEDIRVPAVPTGHREAGPAAAFRSLDPREAAMTERQRREVIQAYHASVSMMDAQVGRVIEALDRLRLREKTIVVFTSDHGYHMGQHGLWQKNTLWESATRVPLIISAPATKNAGKSAGGVVEMLDIYPTLADLAGVPLAHPLEGKSLRPMLNDIRASVKAAAFTQVQRGGDSGISVRTVQYRYTEWEGGKAGVQLYDLVADPLEMKNLAADPAHAVTVAEMKRHVARNWPAGTVMTETTADARVSTKGAGAATTVPPAALKPRPNVLFISLDDLRTTLGCYGDTYAITPNIDRLAAKGTQFMRAYCAQAVCNPSRLSTLTGRRPDTIRVWDLNTHFRNTTTGIVPLPEHFKRNGYVTQSFGKIYHTNPKTLDPQSWSEPAQFSDRENYYALPENQPVDGAWKQTATERADVPDDAYIDGKVAVAAVEALQSFAKSPTSQPFFLAVGIRKPHLPCVAPQRYWDLYEGRDPGPVPHPEPPRDAPELALHKSEELRGYRDIPKEGSMDAQAMLVRRGYYASTTFADAQVGKVMDALESTGLDRNTIVVLWSDHGFHLGEFGLWTKNTNFEAATRVPFIIVTPQHRRPGSKVAGFVELIDIYPTVTELCGLAAPAGLEGRSLVPNLKDPSLPAKTSALSQFIRPWPVPAGAKAPEIMGYSIRTYGYRYTEWRRFDTGAVVSRELYEYTGREELETENLANEPSRASQIAQLSGMLPRTARR